jgi:hypothetical protein
MTTATSSCRAPEGRRTQFASALLASATDPCVARAQICSSVAYLKRPSLPTRSRAPLSSASNTTGSASPEPSSGRRRCRAVRSVTSPAGEMSHAVADGGPGDTAAAHASNGSSRLPTRSAPRQLIIERAECLEPVRRRGKLRQLGNQPHEPLGSHRSATRVARSVCERQEVALCRRHSEGAIRSETRGLEYCDGCFHVS